jgi:hypothetical protein
VCVCVEGVNLTVISGVVLNGPVLCCWMLLTTHICDFHSPIECLDIYSSRYASSLSVTRCDWKYNVNCLPQRNSVNMETCVMVSPVSFKVL